MTTNEILELYKARWNEINIANNHGNITIQRSHTQLLSLTAQVVELLCERIIELENKTKPIIMDSQTIIGQNKIDEIMAKSNIKKVIE